MTTPVFDGHNDALSRLWCANGDPVADFSTNAGHVNVDACRTGGMAGGFFAIYSPSTRAEYDFTDFDPAVFDMPLPPMMDEGFALGAAIGQAGIARKLHDAGSIEIVTDASSLGRSFVGDPITCILHLEGADCIGPDLLALDALYSLGLRSIGIVWSRPTIFGDGVPFAFGRDGDTGPGLTDDGKRLVERCKELGVIIDTSHLTMKGFWDLAEAGIPLVATHSNAIEICNTTRNLTDEQLRAIGETDGIAGLNFGTIFLDSAAWKTGMCGIDACIRHLAHMIDIAGENHVAIGSDFDGAPMPDGIGSAADLQNLAAAMEAADFGTELINKITHENWLDFLNQQFEGPNT
ncbi:MAG: dipeptidase [Boseongicola sp.]